MSGTGRAADGAASALDALVPRADVAERRTRRVEGSPASAYRAFRALTPGEVPLVALLLALRSLPDRLACRPGLPSRLDDPMFGQFVDLGFTVLHDRPGREVVAGAIAQVWRPNGRVVRPAGPEHFAAFDEPGFVKVALGFRAEPAGSGALATSEVRVQATDRSARRSFGRYWLVVRPFSAVVRRAWLSGVGARLEAGA